MTVAANDMKAERWPEAAVTLEQAIARNSAARAQLAPLLARAHDEVAWAAYLDVELNGKPVETLKDALGDSERAVALAPEDRNVHDTRGKIYLALGRVDEALADLDRAVALGIDGVGTLAARGRARELKGDSGAAIEDYRKAITADAEGKSYPQHAQRQARARLQALGVAIEDPSAK